jgi:glycosyltransferase involved in cell wall biosynthesis
VITVSIVAIGSMVDREPSLPEPSRETGRARRLAGEIWEPIRFGGLRHPLAVVSYLRGRLLRTRGRSNPAAGALSQAHERDPEMSVYLGELGVQLARLGRMREAREIAQTLERRDDLRGDAGGRLGRAALILVGLGDVGAAAQLASRAAAATLDGSPAQRTAALVLERAGEPTRALELARRCGNRVQERRLLGVQRELEPGWIPGLPKSDASQEPDGRRVLYLLEASLPHTPSGYAYRSREVLCALRGAGFDPIAATRLGFPASRGISADAPIELVDGVPHHRINVPGLRQYTSVPIDVQLQENANWLLELVTSTQPSVIFAGTPARNGKLALALKSATGIPIVYDVRGFPEMTWATQPGGSASELYGLRRAAETACVTGSDAAITLSETMRDQLLARGAEPEVVFTVPHVVDVDRFSPRPPNEELVHSYGLMDRFVVGSVTSLTEYEGLDVLLRAVARAAKERPDLAVLVIGGGPARRSLEELADDLGIRASVVFTGRIDQARIPDHYALLDLFAVPRHDLEVSRSVTPLKPFEALAMGLPVLASDLPALAEPVRKSDGGRLVPAESEEALAAAILDLAGDAAERSRLGSNAREFAVESHGPARAVDGLDAVLRSLLG